MDWQAIAKVAAPTLATALLGPLGGVAASVVANTLFGSDTEAAAKITPAEVINKIGEMSSPEDMAKLKQAELDLKKFEADNNFRFAQLQQADVADARKMRTTALSSGNKTADQLSWIVLGSFLVVTLIVLIGCGVLIGTGLQVDTNNSSLWLATSSLVGGIIGYFSSNANQVIGFYFGSSAGSAAKSDQLASNTETAINAIVENQNKPSVVKTETAGATVTTASGHPAADELASGAGSKGSSQADPVAVVADPRPAAAAAVAATSMSASARFDACVTYVLEREGGFSEVDGDSGGATNFGITQRTLAAWRHTDVTAEDVKTLGQDEAKAIYYANYWNVARCDALPAGVDLSVFDAGVMSGPAQGVRFMQKAAGLQAKEVDGAVGQQTLAAVAKIPATRLVDEIAAERDEFYQAIVSRKPENQKFLVGWKNRVELTRARAQSMSKLWTVSA